MTETLSGGHANEMFGRVAFGFGAVLACVMFLAFLIGGARRLMRHDKV